MRHHAQIVFTSEPKQYKLSLKSSEIERTQIIDIWYDRLGIDEVRQLITESYRQPIDGFDVKLVVVRAALITSEAQQATLKILEEPPVKTAIQLILPTGTNLLPTVLSRVVTTTDKATTESLTTLSAWLAGSYKNRLDEVSDRTKNKDIDWMRAMKQALRQYLEVTPELPVKTKESAEFVLRNILERGASNKMLLEELALTMPLTSTQKQ